MERRWADFSARFGTTIAQSFQSKRHMVDLPRLTDVKIRALEVDHLIS
jgi:hypothetical protein